MYRNTQWGGSFPFLGKVVGKGKEDYSKDSHLLG